MRIAGVTTRLFAPGVAVLSRVRYATKFSLVGVLIALPLLFVSYSYVGTERDQIAFNAKELDGIAAMGPMMEVLAATTEARTAARLGEPVEPMNMLVLTATLAIEDELPEAMEAWRPLSDRLVSATSSAEWDRAVADVRQMMVVIGDVSNMTLDPELDSYYLMDAVQFRIPALIDVLSSASDDLAAATRERRPVGEARIAALGHLSVAREQLTILELGMDTVDETLVARHGESSFGMEWFDEFAAELEPAMSAIEAGDPATVPAPTWLASWEPAAEKFDWVVTLRIERLVSGTTTVIIIAAVTIAAAAYVAVSLYLALVRPVRAMQTMLTHVGHGDLSSRITVQGRDELADIAGQINRTVSAVEGINRHLHTSATHDTLTGLPNRALILQRVADALRRGRTTGEPVAVCFIDLDRFKMINDSLGHEAGDLVLKEVAVRLRAGARPQDVVGRLAGDEFVVLCEHVHDQAEAILVANRIVAQLTQPVDVTLEGATHRLSANASVGLTVVDPTGAEADEIDADTVLRDADVAMYEAKKRGRGRLIVFHDEFRLQAEQRLAIHEELSRGIERGELVTFYQPTVSMRTGLISGFEALVRWQHPERGLLPPGAFLAEAEESDLIGRIGLVVMEQACRDMAHWRQYQPDLTVSVNVSARQLGDPKLVAQVQSILSRSGLDPEALTLELTESTVMHDAKQGIDQMRALKGLGLSLAIDDFGTGFSSLSYLARMPVDIVKIDRMFVDGLDGASGHENAAIVGSVVSLARGLRLSVTAEGVERQAHVDVLGRLGVDTLQGYLFGKPQDAVVSSALIGRRLFLPPPVPTSTRV
jgi:diguanylate cyclase (GGDEF)-like protein